MVYLRLSAQESVDLLRVLIESGERKISARLEAELTSTLEELDKIDRDNLNRHAKSWLDRQQAAINAMEK